MAKLTVEEMWRQMLTGDYPRLHRMRRMWGALPSSPGLKTNGLQRWTLELRGEGETVDAWVATAA